MRLHGQRPGAGGSGVQDLTNPARALEQGRPALAERLERRVERLRQLLLHFHVTDLAGR